MNILRSFAGVIGGYLVFAISAGLLFHLTGRNPRAPASASFIILTTVYGFFFAALGGYIAARIAGRNELLHGAALACLMAFVALISLLAELGSAAIWSQISALLFMVPAVLVGAMIRVRRVDRAASR